MRVLAVLLTLAILLTSCGPTVTYSTTRVPTTPTSIQVNEVLTPVTPHQAYIGWWNTDLNGAPFYELPDEKSQRLAIIPPGGTILATGERLQRSDGTLWVKVVSIEGKIGWMQGGYVYQGTAPSTVTMRMPTAAPPASTATPAPQPTVTPAPRPTSTPAPQPTAVPQRPTAAPTVLPAQGVPATGQLIPFKNDVTKLSGFINTAVLGSWREVGDPSVTTRNQGCDSGLYLVTKLTANQRSTIVFQRDGRLLADGESYWPYTFISLTRLDVRHPMGEFWLHYELSMVGGKLRFKNLDIPTPKLCDFEFVAPLPS